MLLQVKWGNAGATEEGSKLTKAKVNTNQNGSNMKLHVQLPSMSSCPIGRKCAGSS